MTFVSVPICGVLVPRGSAKVRFVTTTSMVVELARGVMIASLPTASIARRDASASALSPEELNDGASVSTEPVSTEPSSPVTTCSCPCTSGAP